MLQTKSSLVNPIITSSERQLQIRGSIPYWDQTTAASSFRTNIKKINYVSFFWYYLDSSGKINKYQYATEDKPLLSFASSNGVKTTAVITNLPESSGSDWDSSRVQKVISTEQERQDHINNIVMKLDSLNFDGVTIDYEQLNINQRDNFSTFIKELSFALHKKGRFVNVALHPKTGDNKPDENNGSRSQDWKALSNYADQLSIMGYDEHGDSTAPGPIASIVWVRDILNYAKNLDLPMQKVFLGIPLYGYSWKTGGTTTTDLTYPDLQKLIKETAAKEKWDETSMSPYLDYSKNGKAYQAWYENSRSVEAKINLATEFSVGGISFWRLGEEDPQIWTNIPNSQ